MPAASSMIRTVPGGKVGPAATVGPAASAPSSPPPDGRPTRKPISTTSTTPSTDSPITHPVRPRRGDDGGTGVEGGTARWGGTWTGGAWTTTPGPAGVVTSDHADPLHQRTIPGAPSGSGYQPDGALPVCHAPLTSAP